MSAPAPPSGMSPLLRRYRSTEAAEPEFGSRIHRPCRDRSGNRSKPWRLPGAPPGAERRAASEMERASSSPLKRTIGAEARELGIMCPKGPSQLLFNYDGTYGEVFLTLHKNRRWLIRSSCAFHRRALPVLSDLLAAARRRLPGRRSRATAGEWLERRAPIRGCLLGSSAERERIWRHALPILRSAPAARPSNAQPRTLPSDNTP